MAEVPHIPQLGYSGAVAYWSIGPTCRQKLLEVYRQCGFEEFMPAARTDSSALAAALKSLYGGAKTIVQPHKKREENGYEVVQVERCEHRNDYTVDFCAKLVDGRVVTWYGAADTQRLQAEFDAEKAILPGMSVSKSLVDLLKAPQFNGICLRPAGGVYWLPNEGLPLWRRLAEGIEQAAESKSAVYTLQTAMDYDTVRAVRDAIDEEVMSTAKELVEQVTSGELGERALESRKQLARQLRDKVRGYEGILGEALTRLHNVLAVAEQAAASAIAMQEHAKGGAFEAVFG